MIDETLRFFLEYSDADITLEYGTFTEIKKELWYLFPKIDRVLVVRIGEEGSVYFTHYESAADSMRQLLQDDEDWEVGKVTEEGRKFYYENVLAQEVPETSEGSKDLTQRHQGT